MHSLDSNTTSSHRPLDPGVEIVKVTNAPEGGIVVLCRYFSGEMDDDGLVTTGWSLWHLSFDSAPPHEHETNLLILASRWADPNGTMLTPDPRKIPDNRQLGLHHIMGYLFERSSSSRGVFGSALRNRWRTWDPRTYDCRYEHVSASHETIHLMTISRGSPSRTCPTLQFGRSCTQSFSLDKLSKLEIGTGACVDRIRPSLAAKSIRDKPQRLRPLS